MLQQKINTIASVTAAILTALGIYLTIYELGADTRRAVAFRMECRSQVGAEMLLLEPTRDLMSKDLQERQKLGREWQLILSRLHSLRAIAATSDPGDFSLSDGLDDAIAAAQNWNRPDYFGAALNSNSTMSLILRYQYFRGIAATVDETRETLFRAAGEIR